MTQRTLNPRHEVFCQKVASGASASAAYHQVYGTSGATAEASASRLLRNAKVSERIRELQSEAAQATVMSLTEMRGLLREIATDKENPPAARVRAIELDARLAGEMPASLRATLTTDSGTTMTLTEQARIEGNEVLAALRRKFSVPTPPARELTKEEVTARLKEAGLPTYLFPDD